MLECAFTGRGSLEQRFYLLLELPGKQYSFDAVSEFPSLPSTIVSGSVSLWLKRLLASLVPSMTG